MMHRYRFRLLWATLLLLLLFYPFIRYFELTGLAVVLNAILTLILISSVHAVSDSRRHLLLALAMTAPAVIFSWTDQFFPSQIYQIVAPFLLAMAFGFVAVHILRFALQTGRVDAAKVDAAICVYLLIGVVWQYFYILVNNFIPESFANPRLAYGDFLYFSFVTLTTLGYGDITPLNGPAQALAYTEAILGQLYLTILVARLVGLYITYTTLEGPEDD
jgi:voltage-gated potassium channel